MLQALDRLSDVGVRVIKASKDATIDSLRQLDPVLTELAASGDDFVNAFNVFLTYPFVDEVVGRDPQVARNLHMGDYTNLSIELDLTRPGHLPTGCRPARPTLPTNLPTPADDPRPDGDPRRRARRACRAATSPARRARRCWPPRRSCSSCAQECAKKKNQDKAVCKQLNAAARPADAAGAGGRGRRPPLAEPRRPGAARAPASGPTTRLVRQARPDDGTADGRSTTPPW